MKNIKFLSFILYSVVVLLLTNACVEQIDLKTISFDDALVVEGSITNENKFHQIKLSRTFKIEDNTPTTESNAKVEVIDDAGNTYHFEEETPGVYLSEVEFKAETGRQYQLKITTSNGRSYSSQPTQITNEAEINEVIAVKEIDSNGNEGISIQVSSYNANGDARYYRYEFEETYKIITPYWSAYDAVVISDVPPFKVDFVPRTKEEKTCYNTIFSEGIIQTETNSFVEDRVSKFPVRFISKDDFIITNRYSILLKQYVQSIEAYTFYNILNNLSGSESLFSQNQPGFFSGNISSDENSEEKVIGFFEVASVATKRIFVNPREIIETSPPYISNCELVAPLLVDGSGNSSPLIDAIKAGTLKFFQVNGGKFSPVDPIPGGPYQMVPVPCSDCTVLGTNVKPDFWIE
ncbi:DUF4249 domain-containing protein [Lutibacter sp. A64]|uniref:DUF4249 domain-containing protein n=1 Tax=Lutibacter sp. A64 TaxID=2918526 RepID=UPI001F058084|nr:DUF4249 domain-containing protein [Lutibacter sp. A64]UMB52674.1 DUF4249 domain-containing protein [Lutibacter sp. A64]